MSYRWGVCSLVTGLTLLIVLRLARKNGVADIRPFPPPVSSAESAGTVTSPVQGQGQNQTWHADKRRLPNESLKMDKLCHGRVTLKPPNGTQAPQRYKKTPRIHVFGMYGSGTNALQTVLYYDLADHMHSVCPDTHVRMAAVSKRECYAARTSKHRHPSSIAKWLRTALSKAVFIVRPPFGWLKSVLKYPYQLQSCVRQGWYKRCHCREIQGHDPICPKGIWKSYAIEYYKVLKMEEFRGRVAMVSYRDLVLHPDCMLTSVAVQLGATHKQGHTLGRVVSHMQGRSKKGGSHTGGFKSVQADVRARSYLKYFPPGVRQTQCAYLRGGFPEELNALLYGDCF